MCITKLSKRRAVNCNYINQLNACCLLIWLGGTQKSVGSEVIGLYYHMRYVFLLSIWQGNLKCGSPFKTVGCHLKWWHVVLNGG